MPHHRNGYDFANLYIFYYKTIKFKEKNKKYHVYPYFL